MHYEVTSVSGHSSKKGRRAQVTVLVGEGRNRRSFTRHVVQRGSSWVGLNPDPRAIPLNAKYEDDLRKAQGNMNVAEGELDFLKKKLEAIGDIENPTVEEIATINQVEEAILAARAKAMETDVALDDAETKLNIIRRELPLEVEFSGPGLTY